jgi:hypothetical protein
MSQPVSAHSTAAPLAITRMEKAQPNGWSLNMYLVSLGNGELLVHSPTWLGEGTFEKVEAVGTPRILWAPNHFHHLSLGRYRERYPEAVAVACQGALTRLGSQGHQGLADLETVRGQLPSGAHWLVPPGTKSGEAWLSLPGESGRTWLVCDSFFNVERPVRGLLGVVMRLLGVVPGLRISKTFALLALRDRRVYAQWVLEALEREKPTRLLVSHGEPVERVDLAGHLAQLVRERLG